MPMATGYKCFNCGKGIMVGHNVSHAKNRTRKVFKPNLHKTRLIVDGRSMRVRLCTKCLRVVKGKDKKSLKVKEAKLKSSEMSSSAPAVTGLA